MPRPSRIPLNSSEAGWVGNFNDNAEALLDAPLPLGEFADETALGTAYDPRLNRGCVAVIGTRIYKSDGTDWLPYRERLLYAPDLNPADSLADVVSAYNSLLADMQAKDWMI